MLRRASLFSQHRVVTTAAAGAAAAPAVVSPSSLLVSSRAFNWDGAAPVDPTNASRGRGRGWSGDRGRGNGGGGRGGGGGGGDSHFPRRHFRGTVSQGCTDLPFAQQVIELKRLYRGNARSDQAIADAKSVFTRCVPADAASPEFAAKFLTEENATLFLNGARFFGLHTDPALVAQVAAAEEWLLAHLVDFADKYYFVTGALTAMQIAIGTQSPAGAERVRQMMEDRIVPRVQRELGAYTLPMFEQALRLLTWLELEDDKALWTAVADAVRAREGEIGNRLSSMIECSTALIAAVPQHEVVKDLMDTLFANVAAMRSEELARFTVAAERYVVAIYSSAPTSEANAGTGDTQLLAQVKELIGRWGVRTAELTVDELKRGFPALARIALALQQRQQQDVGAAGTASTLVVAQLSEVRDLMQVVLDDAEWRVARFIDPCSPREVYCQHPEDVARILFAYESFGRSSSLSAVALFRSFAEYMERAFDSAASAAAATPSASSSTSSTSTPSSSSASDTAPAADAADATAPTTISAPRPAPVTVITPHAVSLALGVLSRTNCLSRQLATRCAAFIETLLATTHGAQRKPSDYFMALEEAGFCALALSQHAFSSKQCASAVATLQEHVLSNWPAESASGAAAGGKKKTAENSVAGVGGRRIPIMGFSAHAASNAAVTTAISLSFVGGAAAEKKAAKLLPAADLKGMRTLQLVQMWNAAALLQLVKAKAENATAAPAPKKIQELVSAEIKARLAARGAAFGALELRMLCITSARNAAFGAEIQRCIQSLLAIQAPPPSAAAAAAAAPASSASSSSSESSWISAVCVDLLRFLFVPDRAPYLGRALATAQVFAVSGNQFVHLYHLLAEMFPAAEEVRAWGKKGAAQLLKRDRATSYALVELARRNAAVTKGVVDGEFMGDLLTHVLPKTRFADFARTANAVALLAASSAAALPTAEHRDTIARVAASAVEHFGRGGTVYSSSFTPADLLRDLIKGAEKLCEAAGAENNAVNAILQTRRLVQAIERSGLRTEHLAGTKIGAAEVVAAALRKNDGIDAATAAQQKALEAGAAAAASVVKRAEQHAAAVAAVSADEAPEGKSTSKQADADAEKKADDATTAAAVAATAPTATATATSDSSSSTNAKKSDVAATPKSVVAKVSSKPSSAAAPAKKGAAAKPAAKAVAKKKGAAPAASSKKKPVPKKKGKK